MARFAIRRRTAVWLTVIYAASFVGLVWFIPHRPRLTFSVSEQAHLIGFSPDGGRLAVASSSPWQAGLYNVPNNISLWDVGGRWPFAAATRLSERPAGWLNYLAWNWVEDPGREWLFWQCVDAEDVPARLRELLRVEVEAGDIDPTEDVPRIRVSPDGTYVAARSDDGAYRVVERTSGRQCVLTPVTESPPKFGPATDEMTILEKLPTSPDVTVHRWNLKTRRGDRLARLNAGPRTTVRLTQNGRWLVAFDGAQESLSLWDPLIGTRVVTNPKCAAFRYVIRGDRFVSLNSISRGKFYQVQVHNSVGAAVESAMAESKDGRLLMRWAAVSPDGATVALAEQRIPDQSVWKWPRWLLRAYFWLRAQGTQDSGHIHIYDVRTAKDSVGLPAAANHVNSLTGEGVAAFSADGRQLAVLGTGGLVRVYDWPLRRPWLFILSVAAIPPCAVGLMTSVYRRLCYRNRAGGS